MDDALGALIGQIVIVDLVEQYLVIGTLAEVAALHVVIVDCDLHDHREANSTKDVYLIETRQLGVRVNRKRVILPRANIIAVSRLDDVVS